MQDKRIVLLGAGNANLQVISRWMTSPVPGVELHLVSDSAEVPYSGMLPGWISGYYKASQLSIHLDKLCSACGVVRHEGRVGCVDWNNNRLVFADGESPLSYDFLAVNTGSAPVLPAGAEDSPASLVLKPLHKVMPRVATLDRQAQSRPFRILVAGGGATAFEVSLALARRYSSHRVTVSIVTGGSGILSSQSHPVHRHCVRALQESGISLHPNAHVVSLEAGSARLDTGERLPCDTVVWATPARGLPLFADSALQTDTRGFLRVHDTLQSFDASNIFAAGDCAALSSHGALPKAGVFSVRQGPVLWQNLRAATRGDALRSYRPQPLYLFLLNAADNTAVMSYGSLAARGRWCMRWKNRIDQKWMQRITAPYAPAPDRHAQ